MVFEEIFRGEVDELKKTVEETIKTLQKTEKKKREGFDEEVV